MIFPPTSKKKLKIKLPPPPQTKKNYNNYHPTKVVINYLYYIYIYIHHVTSSTQNPTTSILVGWYVLDPRIQSVHGVINLDRSGRRFFNWFDQVWEHVGSSFLKSNNIGTMVPKMKWVWLCANIILIIIDSYHTLSWWIWEILSSSLTAHFVLPWTTRKLRRSWLAGFGSTPFKVCQFLFGHRKKTCQDAPSWAIFWTLFTTTKKETHEAPRSAAGQRFLKIQQN